MPLPTGSFDWQEYLIIAEELAKIGAESAWRTAISRAYYAAFHRAEDVYSERHLRHVPGLGGQSHYVVWFWFENHPAKSYRDAGIAGRTLKRYRELADYHDQFPGLKDQVGFQIRNAKKLVADLNRLS